MPYKKVPVKRIKRKFGSQAVKSLHPDNLRIDRRKGHPPLKPGGRSGWQRGAGGGGDSTVNTTTTTTTTTSTTTTT